MTTKIENLIRSENERAQRVIKDAEITDYLYDGVEFDEKYEPDMDEEDIMDDIRNMTDRFIDFIRENEPERIIRDVG